MYVDKLSLTPCYICVGMRYHILISTAGNRNAGTVFKCCFVFARSSGSQRIWRTSHPFTNSSVYIYSLETDPFDWFSHLRRIYTEICWETLILVRLAPVQLLVYVNFTYKFAYVIRNTSSREKLLSDTTLF